MHQLRTAHLVALPAVRAVGIVMPLVRGSDLIERLVDSLFVECVRFVTMLALDLHGVLLSSH